MLWEFGTNSVQLRERKNGFLIPKRHRMKHLDFLSFLLESRRSVIQNHLHRPLSSSIIYAAFVDADSWTICGTFGTTEDNSNRTRTRSAHFLSRNPTSSLTLS